MADLIDAGDNWAGGDTVVVQVNTGSGRGSESQGEKSEELSRRCPAKAATICRIAALVVWRGGG